MSLYTNSTSQRFKLDIELKNYESLNTYLFTVNGGRRYQTDIIMKMSKTFNMFNILKVNVVCFFFLQNISKSRFMILKSCSVYANS